MPFPQSFLDELMARSDIVDVVGSYVQLTRKGANLFGLCPFHSEKTGSFSVSPDKQIYYCFGCKRGGGVINFIMEEENLSFPDAVRFLAKRAGMEVPEEDGDREAGRRRQRLLDLNRDAARFYYQMLQQPEGRAVQEYLDRRKIRRATAVNFGLGASLDAWDALILAMTKKGYTKSELLEAGLAVQNRNGGLYDKFRNRLIFPVIDVRGDVVAFGGRVLDKSEPKYMNSQETPVYSKRRVLYGLNLAKKSKRSNIILCEGNIDVVTLHQAGFDNAVASMGTALTVEQTRLLSRFTKELVLCYDNDNAGKIATERALEILNNSEFSVKVLQLPRRRTEDGKLVKQDADDFIKLQGKDAFEALLTGSENGIEFRMAQAAGKYDLSSDEARVAYCEEVSALLAALANPVEREIYTTRAAETAKITPEAMRLEVQRAFKRRLSREKRQELRRDLNPAVQLQPKERELRYDNIRSAGGGGHPAAADPGREPVPGGAAPAGGAVLLPTAGPCLYHAVAGQGGRTRPLPGGPGGVLLPGGDEPSHRRLPAAGVSAKRTTGAGGLHTHRTDGGREAAGGRDCRPAAGGHRKIQRQKGYWRKAAWQMSLS